MLKLSTNIKTVQEHFAYPGNQFQIPYYQRKYEWGVAEVGDLLSDIIEHVSANPGIDIASASVAGNEAIPKYLIGSVFLYEVNPLGKTPDIFIIDGQQRTTTITLIAMVLENKIREYLEITYKANEISTEFRDGYLNLFISPIQGIYKSPPNPFTLGNGIATKIRINPPSDVYYNQIANLDFNEGEFDNLVSGRYHKNINSIDCLLNKYVADNNSNLERLKKLCVLGGALLNHTNMAVVVATESNAKQEANHANVINIFGRINSRGADLSPSDLLKVYFLERLTGNDIDIAYQWDELFENTEPVQIDLYFSLLLTSIKEEFPKTISDAWVEHLRDLDQLQKNDLLIRTVIPLFKKSHEVSLGHDPAFILLNDLGFNEWQAVVYWMRLKNINSTDRLLNKLLNVCFCLTVLGHHDKTRRKLIQQIFWPKIGEDNSIAMYQDLVASAVTRLNDEDVYSFSAKKRNFILQFISGVLNADMGVTFNRQLAHIEHVLPQNSERWKNENGWSEELIKQWTHKIGNLVYLPSRINIQVSNSPFAEKVRTIQNELNERNQNINVYGLRFSLNGDPLADINWNPDFVSGRHETIMTRTREWLLRE